jgi:hypothetical protein
MEIKYKFAKFEHSKLAIWTVTSSVIFLFLFSGATKFDFHPDESIYLSLSRLSTWGQSGILFSELYSWTLGTQNPGLYARYVSTTCGILFLLFSYGVLKSRIELKAKTFSIFPIVLFCSILIPFWLTLMRVRPESSILMVFSCLIFFIHKKNSKFKKPIIVVLSALLVCNHSIALIVAGIVVIHLFLIKTKNHLLPFVILGGTLGLYINGPLRHFLVNGYPASLIKFSLIGSDNSLIMGSTGGERQPASQILKSMFRDGPFYISDQAGVPSFWKIVFGGFFTTGSELNVALNHIVISSFAPLILFLWALLTSVKHLITVMAPYFCFFLLGYFNPTYSSFVFLISLLTAIALPKSELKEENNVRIKLRKSILILLLGILSINSISFTLTRFISYEQAEYFAMEPKVYKIIENNKEKNILLSERYGAILAATGIAESYLEIVRRTIYKSGFVSDEDYTKIDFVLLDSTDKSLYDDPPGALFPKISASAKDLLKKLDLCESYGYQVVPSRSKFIAKYDAIDDELVRSLFMGIGDIRTTKIYSDNCEKISIFALSGKK